MKTILIITNCVNQNSPGITQVSVFLNTDINFKTKIVGKYYQNDPTLQVEIIDNRTTEEYINLIKNSDYIFIRPTFTDFSFRNKLFGRDIHYGNDYGGQTLQWWADQLNTLRPYDYILFNEHDRYDDTECNCIPMFYNCKKYLKREAYPYLVNHRTLLYDDGSFTNLQKTHIMKNYDPITYMTYYVTKQFFYDMEYEYDVSYLINNWTDMGPVKRNNIITRQKMHSLISKRNNTYILPINTKLSHIEYLKILNSSKINISMWGAGYSCYRDYETLGSKSLLAIKRMPIKHAWDMFTDMQNIIFFSSYEELNTKLDIVLNDDILYNSMLKEQKEIAYKYHSLEARHKQFIAAFETDKTNLFEVHE